MSHTVTNPNTANMKHKVPMKNPQKLSRQASQLLPVGLCPCLQHCTWNWHL